MKLTFLYLHYSYVQRRKNKAIGAVKEVKPPLQLHSVGGVKTEATWKKLKCTDTES